MRRLSLLSLLSVLGQLSCSSSSPPGTAHQQAATISGTTSSSSGDIFDSFPTEPLLDPATLVPASSDAPSVKTALSPTTASAASTTTLAAASSCPTSLQSPPPGTIVATEAASPRPGDPYSRTNDAPPASEVEVAHDGSLAARVPLWVPPGRSGIEPKLALNYSSHAPSGHYGIGWSLSGVGSITRCPHSVANSGTASPVNFDANDLLCVNGEPLVPEPNPPAGQHWFRTRNEGFVRYLIEDATTDAMGPRVITAYEKDGHILIFGGENSSRIEVTRAVYSVPDPWTWNLPAEADATVRYAWGLSSKQDRYGNTMTVTWNVDTFSDVGDYGPGFDFYPTRIDYTANMTTNLAATRTVYFNYSTVGLPTTERHYLSGVRMEPHKVVTNIQMWGPNPDTPGLLRQYFLDYSTGASSPASASDDYVRELSALNECDSSACKPPLRFEYGVSSHTQFPTSPWVDVDTGVTDIEIIGDQTKTPPRLQVADFNNDGLGDIAYAHYDSVARTYVGYYRLGTGDAYAPLLGAAVQSSYVPYLSPKSFQFDYNGDGVPDFFGSSNVSFDSNGYSYPSSGQITGAFPPALLFTDQFSGEIADLNGDGLSDLIITNTLSDPWPANGTNGNWYYRINQGGSFGNSTLFLNGPDDHEVVDVDGDSAEEVLTNKLWGRYSVAPKMTGPEVTPTTLELSYYENGVGADMRYIFADINADGLADAIAFPQLAGHEHDVQIRFNTGGGYRPPIWRTVQTRSTSLPDLWNSVVRVIDYNHDGKHDILLRWKGETGETRPLYVLWFDGDHIVADELTITSTIPVVDNPDQGTKDELTRRAAEMIQVGDFNGDGLADIAMVTYPPGISQPPSVTSGRLHIYQRSPASAGRHRELSRVYRMGASNQSTAEVVDVTYAPLSDLNVHTPATGCTYPQRCLVGGQQVVSKLQTGTDTYGTTTGSYTPGASTSYGYTGGMSDMAGAGFIGFSSRTSRDVQRGLRSQSDYDLSSSQWPSFYPKAAQPIATSLELRENDVLKWSKHTSSTLTLQSVASGTSYFTYASSTDSYERDEVANQQVRHSVTQTVMDDKGTVTSKTTSWDDGAAETVVNTPTYDTSDGTWPRISTLVTQETSQSPAGASQDTLTRTTTRTYDTQWGLLQEAFLTSTETDRHERRLLKVYTRTPEGLVDTLTMSEPGRSTAPRTFSYCYDVTEHMFPEVETNYFYSTSHVFHRGLGVTARDVDPNGAHTDYIYDGFGRPRQKASPTGAVSYWSYPLSGLLGSTSTVRNWVEHQELSGRNHVELSWKGLPLLTETHNRPDGAATRVSNSYDLSNRLTATSLPYFVGATPQWTGYTYDGLDRPKSVTQPNGGTTQYQYSGDVTTTTSPRSYARSTTRNARGQVVATSDQLISDGTGVPSTVTVSYEYGVFGGLAKRTDANGHVTQYVSNRLGKPCEIIDPDSGDLVLGYNGYGDVWAEFAGRWWRNYIFDRLGRPWAALYIDSEDPNAVWQTNRQYQYDDQPNGVGKLSWVWSEDNVTLTNAYDTSGRVSSQKWTVSGLDYTITNGWDRDRLSTVTYPVVPGASPVSVNYNYSTDGALASVSDAGSSQPYWTWQQADPTGHLVTGLYGNGVYQSTTVSDTTPGMPGRLRVQMPSGDGDLYQEAYTYDAAMNLLSRTDALTGAGDTFTYDAQDRVWSWTWNTPYSVATGQVHYTYDAVGNMTARTLNNGDPGSLAFHYDPTAPHRLSSADGYLYDDEGNQTAAPGRTVAYRGGDNLPAYVAKGADLWSFAYDGTGGRVLRQHGDDQVLTVGPYERRIEAGVTSHVFTISAGPTPLAQVVIADGVRQPPLYLHTNHRGDVVLVTDANANIADQSRFDPFGARVSPWNPLAPAQPATSVRQGFIGADQQDDIGLVDLHARLYDPKLASFTAVDPLLPNVALPYRLNGYAYALHNPYKYIDPTGLLPQPNSLAIVQPYNWDDTLRGGHENGHQAGGDTGEYSNVCEDGACEDQPNASGELDERVNSETAIANGPAPAPQPAPAPGPPGGGAGPGPGPGPTPPPPPTPSPPPPPSFVPPPPLVLVLAGLAAGVAIDITLNKFFPLKDILKAYNMPSWLNPFPDPEAAGRKGERRKTRSPDGTPNPKKRFRPDKDNPGWGWEIPDDGKKIYKKTPWWYGSDE